MPEVIRYYINPEKRTVVANLFVEPDALLDETFHIFDKAFTSSLIVTDCKFNAESFLLAGKYTGIATCHPDDTFDIEEGKRIARLKAMRAYMKDRKHITQKINLMASNFATRISEMHNHSLYSLDNIEKRLS